MESVILKFNFQTSIYKKKCAKKLLSHLNQFNFKISHLNYCEPINIDFSEGLFIDMWINKENDGLFESFFGRFQNSKSFLYVYGLNILQQNNVGFEIILSKSYFQKHQLEWISLFELICEEWNPYYAYIKRDFLVRKSYSYSIDFNKIEEVEWYNYWSNHLINSKSISSINSYEWTDIKKVNDGIFLKLTEKITDSNYLEKSEKARAEVDSSLFSTRYI